LDELDVHVERHVVLNKADLVQKDVLEQLESRYDALSLSAVTKEGLDALKAHLAKLIEGDAHEPLPDDVHAAYGVVT
jgi:tRNA U34 5-carboxymethylaminomethyl modifying GTPase MnmE/TrmE